MQLRERNSSGKACARQTKESSKDYAVSLIKKKNVKKIVVK